MKNKKEINIPGSVRLGNELFIFFSQFDFSNETEYTINGYLTKEFEEILQYNGIHYNVCNKNVVFTRKGSYRQDASFFNENVLQNRIKLPEIYINEIENQIDNIYNKTCISVRKGDYLDEGNYNRYYTLTKEYIIDTIKEYFTKNDEFVFVSDDIKWCKENFKELSEEYKMYFKDESFNTKNNILSDFAILTMAESVIVSPSSFSMFGCYLNKNINKKCIISYPYDKITKEHNVIIPDYFIKKNITKYYYNIDKIFLLKTLYNDGYHNDTTETWLKRLNLNYDIFYSTELPIKNELISALYNKDSTIPCLKTSQLDCLLNHYTIIKTSYERGFNNIAILEDDVVFNGTIYDFYDIISTIPKKFKIARFGIVTTCSQEEVFHKYTTPEWGTQFYILNRDGMKYYLDFVEKDICVADLPLHEAYKTLDTYIMHTNSFIHKPGRHTISF